MDTFETVATVFAVAAGAIAWFFMKKKQGASTLGALKSAKNAVDQDSQNT